MVRLARVEVFAADEVAIVHVMNRTVRRCFLMGDDPLTGKNFDHRKNWMENELQTLAAHFGIDLLCYALMSNHFHLVLRSRPDIVTAWDDTDVARRWLMLCPKRKESDGRAAEPTEFEINAIKNDPVKLKTIRSQLSDISWWMRLLSQKIAQRANREDNETGKFWQARFRAVRLLDDTAILACAAYVDLNPIRAALAETIECSEFTSAQQRALQLQSEDRSKSAAGAGSTIASQTVTLTEHQVAPKPIARSLSPLTIDESRDGTGALVHWGGHRASNKGFLPMSAASYIELLDWTARQLRSQKRGATPVSALPVFERLGISVDAWFELTGDFGRLFSAVAGQPTAIDSARGRCRRQRYKVPTRTRAILSS